MGRSDCTRPHSQWDVNSPEGKNKEEDPVHILQLSKSSLKFRAFFVTTWMVAVKGMDGTGQSFQFHVSQDKEVD